MESILGLRRRCLCAEFRLKFSNEKGRFIDEDEDVVSAEIGAVAPLSDTLTRVVKAVSNRLEGQTKCSVSSHGFPVRTIALTMTRSFRMHATIATFLGLPAASRR